ncbi:hypothetical protein HJA90_10670 [Rhizobium bangladeshense]|uniref:hypothetical protein n=1 Tax=Rhizobium bangladeshense TaxID=1138189 RepID=UPI001C838D72|nr:hypothetical protein [Rhizobium bangladeshense]MBX4884046.1 hypothetical protein [Rhizobium bangladeshense]
MTVPSWPATLPQAFLKDGYSEEEADNLLASNVSVGPAKVRRRTTSDVYPITGSMMMSEAQRQIFRSFVQADTKDRAIAFTFPDPHGGSALLVRMRQPPSYAAIGISWRVQIALEVLP